jgi:hypothetical protein
MEYYWTYFLKGVYDLVSHLVYLDHTTKLSNLVYLIQIGYLML